MVLLSNSLYDLNRISQSENSYNYIYNAKSATNSKTLANSQNVKQASESTDAKTIKSSADEASFSDTAAILSLSDDAKRAQKITQDQRVDEQSKMRENKLARIQRYMNRSLQLENEAARDDITVAERQTIQNEINKITLVVNNIDSSDTNSTTEMMENSIKLFGHVVSHDETENFKVDASEDATEDASLVEESRKNILSSAKDALAAQASINNMNVLSLLA